MSVLICKNIQTEGPGTIEDYLKLQKIPYKIVELSDTEVIPNPKNFDTLIMMGGPMSVNEAEIYPYLKEEERLVKEFVSTGRKVLGICLGAQIMAKALGAKVYVGPKEEIGWYNIELTEEGLKDSCMKRLTSHSKKQELKKKIMVFHWHGETFGIPKGALRLASSELYQNQAFKYGDNAYAFQFHVEVKKEMISRWLKGELNFSRIKKETETFYKGYIARAENFYKGFFSS